MARAPLSIPVNTLCVSVDNFLGENRQFLVEHIVACERDFQMATVAHVAASAGATRVNQNVRRARTLYNLGRFESQFVEGIKGHLPAVLEKLGYQDFPLGRFEVQATASNDGDYFRLHRDTGPGDTREISFVYFLHREPRRFSGGELRIYATRMPDGSLTPGDRLHTVSPRQDIVVFFPSRNEHEVLPVRVRSREFADSRFTVNGWIHRAQT